MLNLATGNVVCHLPYTLCFNKTKQTHMTSELCHRYQRIFISHFSKFYTVKFWIYSASSAEIFVQIWSFS